MVNRKARILLLLLVGFAESGYGSRQENLEVRGENAIRYLFSIDSRVIPGGLKDPSGLCWDPAGQELYVADTGNHRVHIMDREGRPLYELGSRSSLSSPADVAVRDGKIFVSDTDRPYIQVLNYRGEPVAELAPPVGVAEGFLPGRLSLGPEGSLLVVDRSSQNILLFDVEKGSWHRLFPSDGFRFITGLSWRPREGIFVVDGRGTAIHVFDASGKRMAAFGSHGTKPSDFAMPGELCIDPYERLWVVDTFGHSIKLFRRDGRFLARFGGMGTAQGQFFYPVDIAFVPPDRIYVLEKGGDRIQVFDTSRVRAP